MRANVPISPALQSARIDWVVSKRFRLAACRADQPESSFILQFESKLAAVSHSTRGAEV